MQPSDNPPRKQRHIVVEGPIGVGKTTLARKLANRLDAELSLEKPADNPFLARFYKSPTRYALPTQLSFLFHRAQQLKEWMEEDGADAMTKSVRVADFMLAKDPLFARVTLDDDEYALYQRVYAQLAIDAPAPHLVIYLQAPVDVLVGRIRKRGVRFERQMERDYLEKLSEAYSRFFLAYQQSALLTVNAARLNFVDNEGDFQLLLQQVGGITHGRHYFNPVL